MEVTVLLVLIPRFWLELGMLATCCIKNVAYFAALPTMVAKCLLSASTYQHAPSNMQRQGDKAGERERERERVSERKPEQQTFHNDGRLIA